MGCSRLANSPIIGVALAWLATVVLTGCGGASLTRAEQHLISQADAICASSQQAMQKAAQHYSEETLVKLRRPDYGQSMRQVGYAAALASVSESKLERLNALKPPKNMRPAFEQYLASERRVYFDDVAALGSAHSVHIGQYIAALARHHRHEQRALELAGDAGLNECANSE